MEDQTHRILDATEIHTDAFGSNHDVDTPSLSAAGLSVLTPLSTTMLGNRKREH